MTTIKVSTELRDELAQRAKSQNTTLAGAIRAALDASDEERFWEHVRHQNATLGTADTRGRTALSDDLADPSDATLSENDAW